jgi:acyl carrier protein
MTLAPEIVTYLSLREDILAKVKQILLTSVNIERAPEEIDPDTALFGTGLGLDSLDAVELMIALEMELGVKLDDQSKRLTVLRSINSLVDFVMKQRGLLPND